MLVCYRDRKDQELSKKSLNNSQPKKPLGEMLLEAGLVSISQIEMALEEQKENNIKIGKILAYHGWIKQETADFFAEKWSRFLRKSARRPIAFYLFAAGLLDQKQLAFLKQQQRQTISETRLHCLALEQGYIKQVTINFFLKYLYKLYRFQNSSLTSLD